MCLPLSWGIRILYLLTLYKTTNLLINIIDIHPFFTLSSSLFKFYLLV